MRRMLTLDNIRLDPTPNPQRPEWDTQLLEIQKEFIIILTAFRLVKINKKISYTDAEFHVRTC